MGAWGHGSFDNDDAQDWLFELTETSDGQALEAAVTAVDSDEYLEAPECSIALAAAEIVAAIHLGNDENLPEEVRAWVEENDIEVSTEQVSAAAVAVAKIRLDSELQELWEDSEEYDAWVALVSNLEANLMAG